MEYALHTFIVARIRVKTSQNFTISASFPLSIADQQLIPQNKGWGEE
jgi:hypothetical protein